MNQDKKIVSLDGTRIETLWSTVEKGTNENGDEYEKKQAVAPRTFEKAIMDDNGTLLSKKIEDILSRISQIGGGEYDVLLKEIEGIKLEIAGLDLEKWNYIVPDGKNLSFKQNGSSDVNVGFGSDGSWNIYYGINNILAVNDLGDIITFPFQVNIDDMLNVAKNISIRGNSVVYGEQIVYDKQMLDNGLTVNGTINFNGSCNVEENHGIYFGNIENKPKYLVYKDPGDQQWHFYGYDSNWDRIEWMRINQTLECVFPNGLSMGTTRYVDSAPYWGVLSNRAFYVPLNYTGDPQEGGLGFNSSGDTSSWEHKIYERNTDASLHFVAGHPGEWHEYVRIDSLGNWTFMKNITAPNLASATAELLSAQQEITEMDLQNIEAQQTLTEMELMIIEGR